MWTGELKLLRSKRSAVNGQRVEELVQSKHEMPGTAKGVVEASPRVRFSLGAGLGGGPLGSE